MNPLKHIMQVLKKSSAPFRHIKITPEFTQLLALLEQGNDHLFITGKAGTGKTTLIQYFRSHTSHKVVVVAPTGIAAINIQGQTIHSFFKFPPRMITKESIRTVVNNRMYLEMDILIIDEISMVRADTLDNIDRFLRLNGRDKHLPFGGVRVVLVGDLYQLPPILTTEEREIYLRLYDTRYFFSSQVFQTVPFTMVELKKIFRQKEAEFIEVLNHIRTGEVSTDMLSRINNRVTAKPHDNHIILCTINRVAESINHHKLAAIPAPEYVFTATVEGEFPIEDRYLPVDLDLRLKRGARVLFVKNDKGGAWVNGSLGTVEEVNEAHIGVRLDTGTLVDVEKDVWENIRYEFDEDTREIRAHVLGSLTQYPLKLAWAITIHKSQGMSFDKVTIDYARSPFESGQTYVALSRCRTLKGLQLTRSIYPNDILIDEKIIEFYRQLQ